MSGFYICFIDEFAVFLVVVVTLFLHLNCWYSVVLGMLHLLVYIYDYLATTKQNSIFLCSHWCHLMIECIIFFTVAHCSCSCIVYFLVIHDQPWTCSTRQMPWTCGHFLFAISLQNHLQHLLLIFQITVKIHCQPTGQGNPFSVLKFLCVSPVLWYLLCLLVCRKLKILLCASGIRILTCSMSGLHRTCRNVAVFTSVSELIEAAMC